MKVLIIAGGTGGHVFPALSIAKKFSNHGHEISWIGKKNSLEEKIASREGFGFSPINGRGFLGKNFLGKIASIFLFGISLIRSFFLIIKMKPDIAISTGGYLSLAPSLSAFLYCPLFIHEQNSIPGLTNKILHRFSSRTFEAFPATFKNNIEKILIVGNPVREEISSLSPCDDNSNTSFRILIIGGSQGSQQINDIMIQALKSKSVKSNWFFTHQVGKLKSEALQKAYEVASANFIIRGFIENMAEAYKESDIIISRSGAMSVSEICAAQKPSILLPLPWSANNHQLSNARFLLQKGAAEVITSDLSNAETLFQLLIELEKDHNRREAMVIASGKVFPKSTSDKIYNEIDEFLKL